METVTVDLSYSNGEVVSTTFHELITERTPWRFDRAARLLGRIVNDQNVERARTRLNALWRVVVKESPALQDVREVRFFSARFAADPELVRLGRPPVEQHLLYDFVPDANQTDGRAVEKSLEASIVQVPPS
ncbi:MAG TPA: hypothetical protein VGW38_28490 [Chloroflexota bacterium]|nr:hypothetical protein [Chloroflexota bacterium]